MCACGIKNELSLNHLLYADDMAMLSLSSEGVQHSLGNLHEYCEVWLVSGSKCTFQILGGCQGRRTGVGVTTVSNSLILGGWVTNVLKNGDKT